MKGTIRIFVGILLVLGGVGAIENSTGSIPLDSLGIAVLGLVLMAWATFDINKLENDR